jgi:aspartate aminotransferase
MDSPMQTRPAPALRVSHMAENLIGSEIIKLAAEVKARVARGETVYNLTIGDFDPAVYPIPQGLLEAIVDAYRQGETQYPPANGVLPLRAAVSALLQRQFGLQFDPEDILISGGARPIIYAIYRTLVDPGDKVIYPVPSWNNNHYVHLSAAQGLALKTRAEDGFLPTAELLRPHLSDAVLLTLCSPLNPTGTALHPGELGRICELILEENARRDPEAKPLYLLYDQIYACLTFGQTEHTNPLSLYPEMRNYTVFVDGISKVFAATGVRVGWGFGPGVVMARMRAILSHVGAWAPRAEQVATARYLSDERAVDRDIQHIRQSLENALQAFHQGFSSLKAKGYPVDSIAPQGALYLTVQLNLLDMQRADDQPIQSVADISQWLMEEAHMALVPFSAFGADPDSTWFRLSVGTVKPGEPAIILDHLERALAALQS